MTFTVSHFVNVCAGQYISVAINILFWLPSFAVLANFAMFCFDSHYSFLQKQNLIQP